MCRQRTVSFLGDSITTFAGCNPPGFAVYYEGERAEAAGLGVSGDTWWARLAARRDLRVLRNASYSGSMVEGAGFPAGSSPERAAALCAGGERPDEVIVFLGTNDYGWGSPVAQAAYGSAATPPACDLASVPAPGEVPDLIGAAELGGFERAYAAMLANVRAACPQAEVWCCTLLAGRLVGSARDTFAHNLRGVPMSSYNEAIARAARACGCRVADAGGLGLDYEAVDGTHPTRLGMAQLAEIVDAAMEGRPVDPAVFGGNLAAWESRQGCCGRACMGCERSRATPGAWSCVCTRNL